MVFLIQSYNIHNWLFISINKYIIIPDYWRNTSFVNFKIKTTDCEPNFAKNKRKIKKINIHCLDIEIFFHLLRNICVEY